MEVEPLRRRIRLIISAVAVVTAIAFVATRPRLAPAAPATLPEMIRSIENRPSDWFMLSRISEEALASDLERKRDIWITAYRAATALTPARPAPRAAFVRAGLTQWMALSPAERKLVLAETAPLLEDPDTFGRLAEPLFHLTGDVALLRESARNNPDGLEHLASLCANEGRFDDFRSLRTLAAAARLRRVEGLEGDTAPALLLQSLPLPIRGEDERLLRLVLARLRERPPVENPQTPRAVDAIVSYAIRHAIGPLDGLFFAIHNEHAASPDIRARLAVALGDAKAASQIELLHPATNPGDWTAYYVERASFEQRGGDQNLAALYERKAFESRERTAEWRFCAPQMICIRAANEVLSRVGETLEISLAPEERETRPYVQVLLDGERKHEGELASDLDLEWPLSPGLSRIEVEILNPFTPRGDQRRVRLSRFELRSVRSASATPPHRRSPPASPRSQG